MPLNFACWTWTSDRLQRWALFYKRESLYPLDLFTCTTASFWYRQGKISKSWEMKNASWFPLAPIAQSETALSSRRCQHMVLSNDAPFVPMERTCRGWIQLITQISQDGNFTVGWPCSFATLGRQGSSTERDTCLKDVYIGQWHWLLEQKNELLCK